MGKVVLLGAGPGELDLLTIKGEKLLKKADCIIYDRLINPGMLDLVPEDSEKIYVGKMNHKHTMPQDEINKLLVEKAKEHDLVVRLKGGDPYVFGRGGEEALFLKENGIDVEIVPGISSSIAALGAAGIPITHRGLAKGFQVITAHSKKDEAADIDYSSLLDETVTLVFLMGLAHVGEIARGLVDAGRKENTPVAVISNGTTNHQKKVIGTLADIEDIVNNSDIVSPAIIVVGEVVTLNSELNYFEKRPLFGKKFFLPIISAFDYSFEEGIKIGARNELKDMLEADGAEVVTVETGVISPIKCDMTPLKESKAGDWIVFTSANGVKSFFWNLAEAGLDARSLGGLKIAAIGSKTGKVLQKFGLCADLISTLQNGVDLAKALNKEDIAGRNVIWFTTADSSLGMETTLDKAAKLQKIICYENKKVDIDFSQELLADIAECDGAIFTCASNAKATIPFINNMPKQIFSIGPACSSKIKEYVDDNIIEADISSYDGIVEIIGESL